jgi:hypothetical protein
MRHITEDLGRIDQAIAMLEGYSRALDLLSGDLAPLENSEMFEDTEARPLAEIKTGLDNYIAALKWKKASLDPNSPERIEQNEDFRGALNQALGFEFM